MVGAIILVLAVLVMCIYFGYLFFDASMTKRGKILSILIPILIICVISFGTIWFFKYTAIGQRAVIDSKSNLNNGLERTITVYTADGKIIAEYTGLIDIETNDGGYVKFDFDGKRYIYYNCFIESIANIE